MHSLRKRSRGLKSRRVCLFLFILHRFFSNSLLGTAVCVLPQQEYLNLIDCNYTTQLYAALRRTRIFFYVPAKYFCCAAALLMCCYTVVVAAAVRHRVPDGKICCCGSLHLIPVFFFLLFKHTLLIEKTWQYCCRNCSLDLPTLV